MSNDDDKTVFGQPLPPAGGAPRPIAPPPQPAPSPAPGGMTPAGKTVFGQPLPPAGGGPARVAPTSAPAQDDTWLGGAFAPRPQHQPVAPAAPQPSQQPLYVPGTGQRPAGSEIFPEIPTAPQAPTAAAMAPRIALSDALKAQGSGAGSASNPLLAAASDLLILLGRLRTGLVEMQAAPLIDHVTREIDGFERTALQAGLAAQDVSDAKYILSATADDIVQNLPGTDRGLWQEYSMAARFFGDRASGVGFYQKMDEAMRSPTQKFLVLELMLTCLSLGFEGQYRAMPNGTVESARIRAAIYETLRRIKPRPDDDPSVRWMPVVLTGARNRSRMPLWVSVSLAAVCVTAMFATLSTLLTRDSTETRDYILAIHGEQPAIAIERTQPILRPYEAPQSSQLERISLSLETEIETGQIELDRTNDWVALRLGETLRFRSGSADLTSDISALAARMGSVLDQEAGPIRVVGHTDSIPPSGRGRYKTNEGLSEARAQAVAEVLAAALAQPNRIGVEGKGAVDPIADNGSKDGRARNRRVEIMIPRED